MAKVETTDESCNVSTIGDLHGDCFDDVVSAGQHFFCLSVLQGGPRFRGEASVPNASSGWASIYDHTVHWPRSEIHHRGAQTGGLAVLVLATLVACVQPSYPEPVREADPRVDVDVNGDGYADLLLAPLGSAEEGADLWIHYGRPDFFTNPPVLDAPPASLPIPMGYLAPSHVGDLDADGTSDLAYGCEGGTCITYGDVRGEQQTVLLTEGGALEIPYIGDVTCDGVDDLWLYGLYRSQDGPPEDQDTPTQTSLGDAHGAVGDLDGDGCDDVLGGHSLWMGAEDGLHLNGVAVPDDFEGAALLPRRQVDLDGDGDLDLPIGPWFLVEGGASLEPVWTQGSEGPWYGARPVGDISGDGVLDWLDVRPPNPPADDGSGVYHPGAHRVVFTDGAFVWSEVEEHFRGSATSILHPDDPSPHARSAPWPWEHAGSPGDLNGDGYDDLVINDLDGGWLFLVPGGPSPDLESAIALPAPVARWVGLETYRH